MGKLPVNDLLQQSHAKVLLSRLKVCIAFYAKPIAEIRSVTCHTGSHLPPDTPYICHNPAKQAAILNLPTPKGWMAELTLVLVIYRDGLPARRQSPIQLVTT